MEEFVQEINDSLCEDTDQKCELVDVEGGKGVIVEYFR